MAAGAALGADVRETAPAKINLALHVTGQRADGYHTLESLVAFADLGDELRLARAGADTLRIIGPFAGPLKADPDNLVTRALGAFRARWPEAAIPPLAVTLEKNLPVAAGLGGGSADAAAMLRALRTLSAVPVPDVDLFALADTLGADVPVCLLSAPVIMSGRGETLAPVPVLPPMHVVLVNPLRPVSTAQIFARLASKTNPPLPPLPDPLTRPAQLGLWLSETRNDLEPPAIALLPLIGQVLAGMAQARGCVLARMSGSGATVFGLFGTGAEAHQAAHELRALWPEFWVAAAALQGAD